MWSDRLKKYLVAFASWNVIEGVLLKNLKKNLITKAARDRGKPGCSTARSYPLSADSALS